MQPSKSISSIALSLVIATMSNAALCPTAWAALQFSTVTGYGGVPLTLVQTGNRAGPAILFIHGISQSYESWTNQLNDSTLQRDFHLIAVDLRGHGSSGKPTGTSAYSSIAFADDISAIITAAGDRRPVLVSWSMGAVVTMEYVQHKGINAISGIDFVGSAATFTTPVDFAEGDHRSTRALSVFSKFVSNDIQENVEGTHGFVRLLTARPLLTSETESIFIYNMMTPAYVRKAIITNKEMLHVDFSNLTHMLTLPVLISHGREDDLVPYQNAVNAFRVLTNSRLSIYEGTGHAPFLESPSRFNRELARFVRAATTNRTISAEQAR